MKNDLQFRSRTPFRRLAVKSHRSRDRESSRISLRKVIQSLKFRKLRSKVKNLLKKSVPASSVLHNIACNYKLWKIRHTKRQKSFFSNYLLRAKCATCSFAFNASKRNLLLSGDVELNPGPVAKSKTGSLALVSNTTGDLLLNYRLLRHGLRPLDVGGGGDCFFKSVSHQLYGDSTHHLEIRALAVQYLRNNPERFIESNLDGSCLSYLSCISIQGTWADNIVIQAVADSLNLRIYSVESSANFSDLTLAESVNTEVGNIRSIYVGHIGELHYVSTLPAEFGVNSTETGTEKSHVNLASCDFGINHNRKRKDNDYMKEYKKKRKAEKSIRRKEKKIINT